MSKQKQNYPKGRWDVLIEYKLCAHRNEQFKDIITLGTTVYIDDPNNNLRFVDVGPMALREFINTGPFHNEVSTVSVVKICKMIPGDIPGFWRSVLRD
jgi:hypothetical protein